MSTHATKVDRSRETGSLVVCTCGFALGPFMDHEKALAVAREHRNAHTLPSRPSPEQRERNIAAQRARRVSKTLRK